MVTLAQEPSNQTVMYASSGIKKVLKGSTTIFFHEHISLRFVV